MNDKDRITQWIDVILHQLSKLNDNKGIELLHACGGECFKASALLDAVNKTRSDFRENTDPQILFEAFKTKYYNTERFIKNGNNITLIFEECTCPIVKAGIGNSYLCNCTLGYSKKIFETLFGGPVTVRLLKSILKGDSICHQEIELKSEKPPEATND